MKNKITFLFLLFILISCSLSETKKNLAKEADSRVKFDIKKHNYDSLTIPEFFKSLIQNHINDFYIIDSSSYNIFCQESNLLSLDSTNLLNYFSIEILHKLFTSQTASNCSRGEIINIPYQWHWVDPNPRYEIYFTNTNKLLKDTKPSEDFVKYQSFADIDRTPYLFLSDLVDSDLKYYSEFCDTFSTFGWCSEREMAFVALITLLDFEAKVVSEGNHSWSEIIIPFKLSNGLFKYFQANVDNTFNSIKSNEILKENESKWRTYFGESNHSKWYNRMANSKTELNRIKFHLASSQSMERIERDLVKFLSKKLTK